MGLIKLIIKILVLPLVAAVTLIQWVGIFFTQFSTVIFNLLGCSASAQEQKRSDCWQLPLWSLSSLTLRNG